LEILGFIFGLAGLAFGIMSHSRIDKLEKKLKELEVLDQSFSSGQGLR